MKEVRQSETKGKKAKKERFGRVVQIIGPVVDVEFKDIELPEIYHALRITNEDFDEGTPQSTDDTKRDFGVRVDPEVEGHESSEMVDVIAYPCTPQMDWPGG
jgi:F-type H+-transporting ATPase subunit beta